MSHKSKIQQTLPIFFKKILTIKPLPILLGEVLAIKPLPMLLKRSAMKPLPKLRRRKLRRRESKLKRLLLSAFDDLLPQLTLVFHTFELRFDVLLRNLKKTQNLGCYKSSQSLK